MRRDQPFSAVRLLLAVFCCAVVAEQVIESGLRHALIDEKIVGIGLKPQERAAVDPIEGQ